MTTTDTTDTTGTGQEPYHGPAGFHLNRQEAEWMVSLLNRIPSGQTSALRKRMEHWLAHWGSD